VWGTGLPAVGLFGHAEPAPQFCQPEAAVKRGSFAQLATRCATLMGHPGAFIGATTACIIWAVSGPIFRYSDTWQLVINTATTVLTFLAVFLIQNSQNRDGAAIQAKLDEILRAIGEARSGFVGIERLDETEIEKIRNALQREVIANQASEEGESLSVDELLAGRADGESSDVPLQRGQK
jgi:low affinity Fe/Cu permease